MVKKVKQTVSKERVLSAKQLNAQKKLRDALHYLIDSYTRTECDNDGRITDLWTELAQNVSGKSEVTMEQRKAAKDVGFKLRITI